MQRWLIFSACVGALVLSGCSGAPSSSPSSGAAVKAPEGAIKLTPENTKITFVGTKPDGKHDGGFKEFTGYVDPGKDAKEPLRVEIETASLYSDAEKLTTHLKAPDFFDVNNHPRAAFTAKKIEEKKDGDNTHVITGDLTLLGKTNEVSFPAKVTLAEDRAAVDATFKIDRTKWGMDYGQGKVDNEVTITVKVDATK